MRRLSTLQCVALAAELAAVTACGGQPRTPAAMAATIPALGALRRTRVVVFPTQVARVGAIAPEWGRFGADDSVGFLRRLDAEIATTLSERGTDTVWALAAAVASSARRNPTVAPDPHVLSVGEVLSSARRNDPALGPQLGSQIRALVALQDDARYALLPTDVRFEPTGGGLRAVLHLVLIDARASQVRWTGDVASDAAPSFSPATVRSIAERLAALVSTR